MELAEEQRKLWNGHAGHAWVEAQQLLDQVFQPFEDMLVAAAEGARSVLDVGCGTGSTTLAIAKRTRSLGIDISEPMIATARARADSRARFILGDAQTYRFEPASFDRIVSRFGVMFFEDSVTAFANMRRAATNDAKLRCLVWRSPAENPFMTTAERAAAPLLPNLPARRLGAPGQFAFADAGLVRGVLERSGWSEIAIEPIDVACSLPETDLVVYLTLLGPVGLMLRDADEQTRARVISVVRPAFDRYVEGDEVRFTAACWMISARA